MVEDARGLGDGQTGENVSGSCSVAAVQDLVFRRAAESTELDGVLLALASKTCVLDISTAVAEVGGLQVVGIDP